jgi:hypothetical protein
LYTPAVSRSHFVFQNESQEEEQELSEVFMKTLNYTQRFAKFKNMENIAAVRSLVTLLTSSRCLCSLHLESSLMYSLLM